MDKGLFILIMITLVSSILTSALYYINKNKFNLSSKTYMVRQVIFGVFFGIIAILGTEFGIHTNGAITNIRDAAPLCAGLYFGPEAGIIAGFIGGIERWFAVYWGVGEFTRLACTVGTIFAGIFGALVKKYIFEDRVPSVIYAFIIGGVTEVFHMLMVYLFRGNEALQAHQVIVACAPVMIPLVAIAVAIPAYVIAVIDGTSPIYKDKSKRKIAQNIAIGLSVSVLVAFILSNAFEISLQNKLANTSADKILKQSLTDSVLKIKSTNDGFEDEIVILGKSLSHRHVGASGEIFATNNVGEIVANKPKNLKDDVTASVIRNLKNKNEYKLYKIKDKKLSSDNDYYYSFATYKNYKIIGIYPAYDADLTKNMANTLTALLEIAILWVVFFMIYILIRIIVVRELNTINTDLSAISNGNLDTVVDVKSSEEFTLLSKEINTTVNTLKRYIADAEQRVAEELKMAKNIQRSALPTDFPNDERFDIYANMLAAKDVGGDFYDFYPVGDDKYAILIADVSGKGIPAAMFMMSAKTIIKNIVERGASPAEAFIEANNRLCEDNSEEMFVTAWLGIIDLNTGKMKFANAGHNFPIVKNEDGSFEYLKSKPGFVLAGMEGMKYEDFDYEIKDGDGIYLYTDGVSEATNIHDELFGEERLLNVISEADMKNPAYTCKYIKKKVDDFVGEAPQFDDITMLVFRRGREMNQNNKITTALDDGSTENVMAFFDEFIEKNNIPQKTASKIFVAVDEIYSNILFYSEAEKAEIYTNIENDTIHMTFKDNGKEFNPLENEDPDISADVNERKIGGLGIFIVKNFCESIEYKFENGYNILEVVLNILY